MTDRRKGRDADSDGRLNEKEEGGSTRQRIGAVAGAGVAAAAGRRAITRAGFGKPAVLTGIATAGGIAGGYIGDRQRSWERTKEVIGPALTAWLGYGVGQGGYIAAASRKPHIREAIQHQFEHGRVPDRMARRLQGLAGRSQLAGAAGAALSMVGVSALTESGRQQWRQAYRNIREGRGVFFNKGTDMTDLEKRTPGTPLSAAELEQRREAARARWDQHHKLDVKFAHGFDDDLDDPDSDDWGKVVAGHINEQKLGPEPDLDNIYMLDMPKSSKSRYAFVQYGGLNPETGRHIVTHHTFGSASDTLARKERLKGEGVKGTITGQHSSKTSDKDFKDRWIEHTTVTTRAGAGIGAALGAAAGARHGAAIGGAVAGALGGVIAGAKIGTLTALASHFIANSKKGTSVTENANVGKSADPEPLFSEETMQKLAADLDAASELEKPALLIKIGQMSTHANDLAKRADAGEDVQAEAEALEKIWGALTGIATRLAVRSASAKAAARAVYEQGAKRAESYGARLGGRMAQSRYLKKPRGLLGRSAARADLKVGRMYGAGIKGGAERVAEGRRMASKAGQAMGGRLGRRLFGAGVAAGGVAAGGGAVGAAYAAAGRLSEAQIEQRREAGRKSGEARRGRSSGKSQYY